MSRLAPIEKPVSLKARLAYRIMKKRFGKVITPAKVVYNRVPEAWDLGYRMGMLVDKGLTLDAELKFLVQTLVSSINECAFCVDFAEHRAKGLRVDVAKARAIRDFASHPKFTARERAALAYAEEVTEHKRVSDETFAVLREHFNEREIVELTLLTAIDNFYNLVNVPLGIESDGFCSSQPFGERVEAS
jgi:AhpD family alkylhydroperoxidase